MLKEGLEDVVREVCPSLTLSYRWLQTSFIDRSCKTSTTCHVSVEESSSSENFCMDTPEPMLCTARTSFWTCYLCTKSIAGKRWQYQSGDISIFNDLLRISKYVRFCLLRQKSRVSGERLKFRMVVNFDLYSLFEQLSLFVPFIAVSTMDKHKVVQKFKSIINSGFEKLAGLSFPDASHTNCDDLQKKVKIVMILPIYGRYGTFLRFLNNYEEVRSMHEHQNVSYCNLFTFLYRYASNQRQTWMWTY